MTPINIMKQLLALAERVFLQLFTRIPALISRVRRRGSFFLHVADDHYVCSALQVLDAEAEYENGAERGAPGVLGPGAQRAFQVFQDVERDFAVQFMHHVLDLAVQEARGEIRLRCCRPAEFVEEIVG